MGKNKGLAFGSAKACFGLKKNMMTSLKRAKLFFGKPGLLENFAKCSGRQSPWMHGYVGLSAIGMAQDLVATTLSYFNKSGPQKLGQNFTGGVRHRRSRLALSATWIRWESFRRETAFPRPTPRSIPGRQRWLLQCLPREWSGRELGRARNSNLQTQVRLSPQ
jgi:hypothetical protein